VPELLDLVLQKVIPTMHSSFADASVFTPSVGVTDIANMAGAMVIKKVGGSGIINAVTDWYNFDALPKKFSKTVRCGPPDSPVITLQHG